MRNLLQFIVNYNFFLLFLLIEGIAVFITIKHSKIKTEAFITSANIVSGFFNDKTSDIAEYFSLREQNKILAEENRILLSKFSNLGYDLKKNNKKIKEEYITYQTAEIVKNSVYKKNNFLTIDKGSSQGIKPNMAVVTPKGVVGVTAKVSSQYSTVVSVLNAKMGISAKLIKDNSFGSVTWDGIDYNYVFLNEIPNHIQVEKGDTVVTSGYSAIFPKDIMIGKVEDVSDVNENNFLRIKVKLNLDFKKLRYVYVIEDFKKEEREKLESETDEEFKFGEN